MIINECLIVSTSQLKQAGIDTPRLDALILLEHVTGKDRGWLLAHPTYGLNVRSHNLFISLIKRRLKREPLAYIIGQKEFYGLKLKITPDVLIPRPESEALVDLAIEMTPKNGTLADIGTGSGALAIAIAKNRPDLKITATDISLTALRIARQNAESNLGDKVAPKPVAKGHRIFYSHADLLRTIEKKFDAIVANLPYLPTASLQTDVMQQSPEIKFEPKKALYGGGKDGLGTYRRFFTQLQKNLRPNGLVIIEAEPTQQKELIKIARNYSLRIHLKDKFAAVFILDN